MKKILFIFLFLYSSISFSATIQEAWLQCDQDRAVVGSGSCIDDINVTNQIMLTSRGWHYSYSVACSQNEVFNSITGQCDTAPDCTSGQEVTLGVEFKHFNAINTSSHNGCSYSYKIDPKSCTKDSNGLRICSAVATTTGDTDTNVSTQAPALSLLPTTPVPPADNGCLKGQVGGKTVDICYTKQEKGEGTIDGIPITASSDTDISCINVQGKEICAGGQKNCGLVGGKAICVEEATGSNVPGNLAKNCFTKRDGSIGCITGKESLKSSTTSNKVDNGDGTSTTTKTTSNNVAGSPDYTTITTTNNTTNNLIGSSTTGEDPKNKPTDLKPVVDSVDALKKEVEGIKKGVDDGNTNLENAFDTSSLGTIDSSGSLASLDSESDSIISNLGQDQVDSSDFLSSVFTWPTSTCSPYQMIFNDPAFGVNLNYTFDPCTKLATFRAMFGWFLYISTAFFIFQLATKGNS